MASPWDWPSGSMPQFAASPLPERYFSPHSYIAIRTGLMLSPAAVSEYST